jgi:hypothetical protein
MVGDENAASGPEGDAGDGTSDSLSNAINAALSATMGDDTDPPEQSAEPDHTEKESAGTERRDGEDADAAPSTNAKATNGKAASNGDARTFEAPKHWPEADRKAFASMPPEGQHIIRRLAKDLEGGFTRRSQELGDKARYADAVRGLIDDRTRQQISRAGANELQYLAFLHGIQEYSARDPVGYVRWAMQNLGVTPNHLGFPAQPQPGQQPQQNAQQDLDALLADPKVKQLEAELASLKGQWNQRQQAEQYAYQNQVASHRQGLRNMAVSFRNALDDGGQLAYPHFDTVHRHMGALMETDPQLAAMPDSPEKMKAAYDMAVWARPDLRQSLMDQEASRRVAAAEKARDVARAKSVTAVKPSPTGHSPMQSLKPKSLDDIIRDSMTKAGIR